MKTRVLIFALLFFVFASYAKADVYISEIMYDFEGTDTDYEWIELGNDGGEDVDITGWKFNDGSNHNLNTPPTNGSTGELVVPSGGFLILAGNASAFNSFYSIDESVIDTVMSMNNTEESISVIDDASISVDSVSFSSSMGANGDGKSLQLISNSWVTGSPTPGAVNSSSGGGSSSDDDNNDSETNSTLDSDATEEASTLEEFGLLPYKTEILVPEIIMAGDEIDLQAYTTNQEGIITHAGTFMWNMGDGNFFNINGTDKLSYMFEYPGSYKINLSYFRRSQRILPDAKDSITVNVVSPSLKIESISKDGAIVVRNSSGNILQIDGWGIISDGFAFFFPSGSTIASNGSITLSPKTTKFPYVPTNLEIRSPVGTVVYRYPEVLSPVTKSGSSYSYSGKSIQGSKEEVVDSVSSSTIPVLANTVSSEKLNRDTKFLIFGLLFVLIGLGFYFYEKWEFLVSKVLKRKESIENKNISPDERDEVDYFDPDDFTILEEDSK